jgi:hypothetical protein
VACLAALAAGAAGALPAAGSGSSGYPSASALLHSRELWATIDVCNPPKEPDTIGVRGSMPGDRRAGDRMYMSFQLQYLTAVNQWLPLTSSSRAYVGGGATVRQGGWSFTLKPSAAHGRYTIRGLVGFRWMHGTQVIAHVQVPTSSGRRALVGADPAGYSAATCTIG